MITSNIQSKPDSFASAISDASYQFLLMSLGLIVLFLILLTKSNISTEFWKSPFLFTYTIFVTTFQLSRIAGAILYKDAYKKVTEHANALQPLSYTPPITFVIPCKNEEKAIEKTVRKCFAAHYPDALIEVIVVNDGSTDNTPKILESLRKEYPALQVIHLSQNLGKRYAMACGFKRAKGEIIIQLDSDSYIDPKTVRNFVTPFQHPDVGAVCGHADPENADENMLTKMQAAYYFMSFRILKAAESTFLTVFCCSGCSSAYRKSVVLPIMDEWLREKFLGLPITWGDDRALTNWVLRKNYRTLYSEDVQAYTIVPNNLPQLLKQQVRWKKGWFVNSLFALKFIFKKHPFVAISYFLPLFILTLLTPIMATKALIYNPIINQTAPTYYIIGVFLVACIITLYYRSVARDNKYWPYLFVWSAINMVALSFVLYYALLRLRDRKWGTR